MNPPAPPGNPFDRIIGRVNRLREWSRLESLFCKLRDALQRFDGKLQQRLTQNRRDFQDPGKEAEMRLEWELITTTELASFQNLPRRFQFLCQPLDNDPTNPVVIEGWVEDVVNASRKVD